MPKSSARSSAAVAPEDLRGEERAKYIHEHDCPKAWDFWRKHALGSKLCPSCLLCGQQRHDRAEEWAITHAELPDIYICKGCVDAARSVPPAAARTTDKVRLNVAQSLWDFACHGGNADHSDRKKLLYKAAELLRESCAESATRLAFIEAAERFAKAHVVSDDLDAQYDPIADAEITEEMDKTWQEADAEYNAFKEAMVKAYRAFIAPDSQPRHG